MFACVCGWMKQNNKSLRSISLYHTRFVLQSKNVYYEVNHGANENVLSKKFYLALFACYALFYHLLLFFSWTCKYFTFFFFNWSFASHKLSQLSSSSYTNIYKPPFYSLAYCVVFLCESVLFCYWRFCSHCSHS